MTTEPEQVKTSDTQPESGEEAPDLETTIEEVLEEYEIYRIVNPEDPCDRGLDTYTYEKSWYDETQIYVNTTFCEPALWFDNFFGSDRVFNEGAAGTYIRWRNDFTYDEEEYFDFKSNLSFSVELPGLESRLRLTFESGEDETLRDISPGQESTTSTLGLQLDVKQNERSKFNISISLSPRIRLRYRYTYPVVESITLRLTQEVQREKAVNSARTLVDFEKLFKNQLFFRSSSEGKLSEEFEGVDWLQAFVLYQRINKKTSLSYETSANGITEPLTLATNYRVAVRFRKNFHRKWLFYEIAPELTWPVTLDEERLEIAEDRRSKWLIFFRLEVHFGNASKKRYEDYY
ncbi:MAG: hypothetical protein OQK93_03015 [Gammaproteobacteria bacterium]|nr:hypothetical protein [Gammaproteobacteria bacterium]